MKKITINCAGIAAPRQLHETLAKALDFPEWYGNNLDALYDCLTELGQPAHLRLQHFPKEEDWAEGFLSVFADAAEENPRFSYEVIF